MTNQRSPRSERLLGLARLGVSSLIRAPVREAVREALAEERHLAEDEAEQTRRANEEERSGDGNRFLRPAMLLSVIGLAAAGAVLKRRRLLELADETGTVDQSSTRGLKQKAAADMGSAATSDANGYEADPGATDRGEPSGRGEHGGDTDGDDFSMAQ